MDVAFIEHAENEVDDDDRGRDQETARLQANA